HKPDIFFFAIQKTAHMLNLSSLLFPYFLYQLSYMYIFYVHKSIFIFVPLYFLLFVRYLFLVSHVTLENKFIHKSLSISKKKLKITCSCYAIFINNTFMLQVKKQIFEFNCKEMKTYRVHFKEKRRKIF